MLEGKSKRRSVGLPELAALVVAGCLALVVLLWRMSCTPIDDQDFAQETSESSRGAEIDPPIRGSNDAEKEVPGEARSEDPSAGAVTIEVVDVTGCPLNDAWIAPIDAATPRGRRCVSRDEIIARTDPDGCTTVDRSRFSLRADGFAGFVVGAEGFVTSRVAVAARDSQVRVRLESGAIFTAVVTDTEGAPLPDVTVALTRLAFFPFDPADCDKLRDLLPGDLLSVHVATSDGRGRIRIGGIESGAYRLMALHDDYALVSDEAVHRIVVPGAEVEVTMSAVVAAVLRFDHGDESVIAASTYLEGYTGNPATVDNGGLPQQRLEKRFPDAWVDTRTIGGRTLDFDTEGAPLIEFTALFSDGTTGTARVPVRPPSKWTEPVVVGLPDSAARPSVPRHFELMQPSGEIFDAPDRPFVIKAGAVEGRPRQAGSIRIGDETPVRVPNGECEVGGMSALHDRCLGSRTLLIEDSSPSTIPIRLERRLVAVTIRYGADFDMRGNRPILTIRNKENDVAMFIDGRSRVSLPAGEHFFRFYFEGAHPVERTVDIGSSGDSEEIDVEFRFDDECLTEVR